MNKINYKTARFIKSINNISHLPKNKCIEIALIGYSNVGKSSLINTLSKQKKLAFVGKKPGTTKLASLFKLLDNLYLIDFPGYGYPNITLKIQKKYNNFLKTYLRTRKSLRGVIILMDIRQKVKEIDIKIIKKYKKKIPIIVLLNKIDKLPNNQKKKISNIMKKKLKKYNNTIDVQTFSSVSKKGVKKLKNKINYWFSLDSF